MFNDDALWLAYKTTRFRWINAQLDSDCFAIITAYNPRSIVCSAYVNAKRQERLVEAIESKQWRHNSLIAGDQGFDYFEPSIAVECSLQDAIELARTYQQNAIYYVEQDTLSLVPVLLSGRKAEIIGRFSQALTSGEYKSD